MRGQASCKIHQGSGHEKHVRSRGQSQYRGFVGTTLMVPMTISMVDHAREHVHALETCSFVLIRLYSHWRRKTGLTRTCFNHFGGNVVVLGICIFLISFLMVLFWMSDETTQFMRSFNKILLLRKRRGNQQPHHYLPMTSIKGLQRAGTVSLLRRNRVQCLPEKEEV